MEELESILLEHCSDDMKEETKEICKSFRIHFLISSHMFSLARTTRKDMKDETIGPQVISALREVVLLVSQSTKRLTLSMKTPKRHLMSHLVAMMIMHGSIGEYFEDWVEQIHQNYLRSIARGKIRNLEKRADYQLRADQLSLNRL
mmetsp:Transcript_15007/g.16218  ORF Transcript_15007/g.16218 Transcript_15007/m.16218 type:complete len:146 (+) Transcript_15007:152-589(+)